MAGFSNDWRLALRSVRKTPAFALAAIVVLALGIGANTAIFSIVNGVLLRPLPYDRPEQLVQLWHTPPPQQFPGRTQFALSAANYLDWEQRNDVFQQSAIYTAADYRLSAVSEPVHLQAARVEPTYFSVMRGHVLMGRAINPGDDRPGSDHIAVLSDRLWQSRFAADPQIVGRKIELDGESYEVVGVMAADFQKPNFAQMWTPLVWDPVEKTVRGEHHFSAVARLKDGVSVGQAQAQLDTIAASLAKEYPADNAGWGAQVVALRDATLGSVRQPLLILLGAVAFVLLIACANVANLFLAKTLERRKEIAIRTALGAKRGRIIRQVLTEAVVLATAGGALGLVVAHFATKLVVNVFGAGMPRLGEIRLDVPVLVFTFAIAVLTGIAAGALPAWRMSLSDPQDALKQGGRSGSAGTSRRARGALVVAEVALSFVLLVGAGLMVRTLWNLSNVNPGFDADHVLTANVGVGSHDFETTKQEIAFVDELLRRLRALPGVQSAGSADSLPLVDGSTQPVAIEGHPAQDMSHQPEVGVRVISPGFLDAMRVRVLRGRDFTEQDNAGALPVALVSESMARQFWPNEDAVGKRLTLTFFPGVVREVVGVVADVKDQGLDRKDPVSALYWPVAQLFYPESMGKFHGFPLTLALRTATDPASIGQAARAVLHDVAPNVPLLDVRPMQSIVDDSLSSQRFNMFLLAAFAALALLLAGVGLYSVLAYSVRQRAREIGVRMALGARMRDVLRRVVIDGMKPTVLGVGIGLAAALALSRLLETLVFGVAAHDVATFAGVSVLMLAVGLLASVLPARRATRVDPLKVLREE